ncbi:zinc finger and SCAN domain-containing protein 2-like isoform X6 [Danaus plexippus]|uniref:zinc finger and SCAN domain-containing protein 2-like isoform X6 n=1 Tax=Danaus plexippus TaxID=13037 RepID=UPI002AAFB4FB|nr:zinc finger and SCAN domain-containing protein 2-like isoform X6 [Danaus plexippus]
MEFDEIVVKDTPGLCRCCLSEGCYKDLSTEYPWMDDTEIYADMLLECFDVSISQHIEGPNGPNRLICEVCITRLRDACNFKKQVLDSEKKFIDMVGRGAFKTKVLLYPEQMKSESQEVAADEAEIEYLDEDVDYDDIPLNELATPSVSEDITVATLPVAKRGRPKKTMKNEKKKIDVKLKTKSKGEPRGGQKAVRDDSEIFSDALITSAKPSLTAKDKRKIMRNNVLQVLLKSTVMPFRWLKSSYRCFYCYDIFQESSDLKNHQHMHVGNDVKEQAMNNYWEPVVYVDISNLACKLCPENVTDLYDLIDHLVAKHEVNYNKDVGVCMVAFKLDNFAVNCLACGASFYTFGPLLHHTNKDHKGISAILCDVCGQRFKDANLLRLHVKTVHENIGLLCPECGEKFETRSKLKTHQKNQHDMDKKYKCLVCSQTFQSHYKRSRHMATEHKNRQEIKCIHCPKTFVFRSMMMTHLRDTHLKVRNHICGVCGWKAFNSHRLKNHMYKHSGEKNFKCDACDKAFTTKKIMRAHFARMHKTMDQPIVYDQHPYVGH